MSASSASAPALEAALLWLVLLAPPLLGLLAWRLPPRRMLPLLLVGVPLPLTTLWLLSRLPAGGAFAGSWAPGGLSLHWRLDGLAGLLLLLTQLVLLASATYAVGHRRDAALT
ncbi:MAG: hypothetical protein ACQEWZ_11815 [Pseudomonadota bacterium]